MSPTPETYDVIAYEERYQEDVLRLRTTFHGVSPAWNADHFRWQQEENPWFEGHQIRLALHRDEVVGMRVLHAAEWEGGSPSQRFRAPCYAGTVIRGGHESRGLISRLTREIEEQVERSGARFAFNLNAGPVTHISALANGWRSLGAFGSVIRSQTGSGNGLWRRSTRVLRRTIASMLPLPGQGVHVSSRPRHEEMLALAGESSGDGRLRHVRDERWFRWRFRDPSSRYRFVYFERNGRLAGYLVFHRTAPPLAAGPLTLVDWERGDDLEWSELLSVVVRLADRWVLPVSTWTAALPPDAGSILKSQGFEPLPPPGPLAHRRPTFLIGRIGPCSGGASNGANGRGWTVGGVRIDDVGAWDLRPIFADPY